jgi:hypothetical protein
MLLLAHAMPMWKFLIRRQRKHIGASAICPPSKTPFNFSLKAFSDRSIPGVLSREDFAKHANQTLISQKEYWFRRQLLDCGAMINTIGLVV